ncbi:hypothetical protein WJX77_001141 [Trebouxia sp. C0004]
MTTLAEAVTASPLRLEQLAHGVRDRGSVLPKGWRCEVIPRKCQLPVRGYDVMFTSQRETAFGRDGIDLLKVSQAAGDQNVSTSTSRLKLISDTAIEELPKCLQEVPIMCNRKQGIWYLADNKVECSDTGCALCLGRPLADRFMSRCGPSGFCRHTGMSAESIWRSSFKVDLPGHEGMSVDNYFRQHGYSLQYVRKAPKNDSALSARARFRGKTTDCRSDSKSGNQEALLKQELENLQQLVATQKASIGQLGQAVKNRNLQTANFQAATTQKLRGGSCSSQDVAILCNAHKQEKAAMQETHEEEKAQLQSAHKQEVGAFKAQAAQAKAEYMQILSEKHKLQDVIYDLKVSSAAHQRHSISD